MPLALSGTPLILLLVSLSTGRHISSNKCFTTHCLFVSCWRFFFCRAACVCMISTCNLCSFLHKWARLHHDMCTLCFFFYLLFFSRLWTSPVCRQTTSDLFICGQISHVMLLSSFCVLCSTERPWQSLKWLQGVVSKRAPSLKTYAKLNKQIRFNKTP